MLFNSFAFLFLFLPLALAGFFAAGAFGRWAGRGWLALASLAFYMWWHPPFLVLLLISIAFNYTMGRLMLAREDRPGQGALLIFAVGCNLAALFWYKYAYAVASGLFAWGVTPHLWLDPVLLPLGISFFTFTQIGFLVDCRGGAVRDRSLVDYVLFVTFFPHLIAGPILHHKEIMPQFARAETYRFDSANLAQGMSLFIIGLAKKALIADPVAAWAKPGFADPAHLTLFGAWGAALAYSVQLYFDFSGYSDMAIGIARMCNVRFPFNFNSPYRARNIIDFWQRWHMTLTRYLNLYLYNPMALSITRRRAARGRPVGKAAASTLVGFCTTVAWPLLFTMGLAGIWHGAGLQFIAFGLAHAVYLTVNHAWRTFGPKPASSPWLRSRAWDLSCLLLTYLCVLVGEVFFRANSLADAMTMLAGMVGVHGIDMAVPVPYWLPARLGQAGLWLQAHGLMAPLRADQSGGDLVREVGALACCYAIIFLAPNSQRIVGLVDGAGKPREMAADAWLKLNLRWGLAAGALATICIMSIGARSEFLYFQF